MSEFNWTCPFCQRAQTVSDSKRHFSNYETRVGKNCIGRFGVNVIAVGCSNPDCKEVSITAQIVVDEDESGAFAPKKIVSTHRLRPESGHKPQPDFIPNPIVQDYIEASLIRDLSPKASATLARRCIQGMIRNFCRIQKADSSMKLLNFPSVSKTEQLPQALTPKASKRLITCEASAISAPTWKKISTSSSMWTQAKPKHC